MEKFKKLSREELKNVTGGGHDPEESTCWANGKSFTCPGSSLSCLDICLYDYGSGCSGCAQVLPDER